MKTVKEITPRHALVECARMCEEALERASRNDDAGDRQAAEEWLERAEWWSDEAFRQVVA